MWGAVIGDIAGSIYEWNRIKTKDSEFFGAECEYTDDTACTAAVAEILPEDLPASATLQQWCRAAAIRTSSPVCPGPSQARRGSSPRSEPERPPRA